MSSENQLSTALAVYQPPDEYRGDITWDPAAASYLEALAARFAVSGEMLPKAFRGKPADCAIVLEMAHRLRVAPFMMFQSVFILHGNPSLSAQFLIAMANAAKRPIKFRDVRGTPPTLPFRRVNKDGAKDVVLQNWEVTAFFADSPEDKVTVDMQQAMTAGWAHNAKYSEIPAQMLGYRAATFLVRRYLPHLAMGLATIDEVADEQAVVVEAEVVPGAPTPPRGMDAVRAAVAGTVVSAAAEEAAQEAKYALAVGGGSAAAEPEKKAPENQAGGLTDDEAEAAAKHKAAHKAAREQLAGILAVDGVGKHRVRAWAWANKITSTGRLGLAQTREALAAAETPLWDEKPIGDPQSAAERTKAPTLSQEAVIAIRTLEQEIRSAPADWPERDLTGWSPEEGAQYMAEMNHKLDELFPQGGE